MKESNESVSVGSGISLSLISALDTSSVFDFVDLNRKFLLYGPVQKLYRRDIIIKYDIHFPVGCAYGAEKTRNKQDFPYNRSS